MTPLGRYAYQVLVLDEFARHSVEVIFLQAPRAETPEDVLLLQFQGMIAEYEKLRSANARGAASGIAPRPAW